MAVRAPTWLTDALRWRWMPTVALVLGSLLYVLGALIFVPSDIQFSGTSPSARANGAAITGAGLGANVSAAAQDGDALDSPDDPAAPRRKRARRRAVTSEENGEAPAEPDAEAATP
jgi:hypothetical protein